MKQLLWPDEVSTLETAPIAILQEQASLLGPKTNHIVEAKVSRSDIYLPSKKHGFRYDFYLYAPILRNYAYHLFSTTHYQDLSDTAYQVYPVVFHIIYEDMRQELESQLGALRQAQEPWEGKLIAKTEEEFCLILSKIFHSKRTQGVIGRMKAQSKDYEPDKQVSF